MSIWSEPLQGSTCDGNDLAKGVGRMRYDVIVVGGGPAGIFAAYELTHLNPNTRVLLIDKGHDIFHRT